ncbi:MAG: hypothetical protein R6X02_29740 [Enhygromyxa sp.]
MHLRTSTLTISLSLFCAASFGLLGCDKGKAPPDNPTTAASNVAPMDGGGDDGGDDGSGSGSESESSSAEQVAWHDMDRQARTAFMGTTVMPAMKDAFKQHGFDTFKCANCHGSDFKEVDYKMPNDLTPLNPDNPIQSGMDLDEEMTKFMVAVVTPKMAELLGEETDVTTGKGEFGCLSCHLSE